MYPLFSFIIPCLNEELFLPKLLDNLVKQKEQNFDIVIVDAKSTDKTKSIIQSYVGLLPLHLIEAKKKNVSYQKNLGAKYARGAFLIFLDADCQISPAFTKKLAAYAQSKKGLVYLPYVDPDDTSAQVKGLFKFFNFVVGASQGMRKPLSSVGCLIFEKNFFQLIGGFNEKVFVYEDQNIVQKAAQWGVKAQFMPKIKIKFSLRRVNREGKLQSLYKLVTATAHVLFKGDVKKKIFEYEMGGHLYSKKKRIKN